MIKIAFIDIDGTLVKGQSQLFLIRFLRKRGLIGPIQKFIISLWFILYKLKIARNPNNILSYALSCFRNKSVTDIEKCMDDFIKMEIKPRYFKYVNLLINDIKLQNIEVVLLSTAVDLIVKKISIDLNINNYISTEVQVKDGLFTGNIIGNHVYDNEKLSRMIKYLDHKNIKMSETLVLADNYSDKKILLSAKIGVVANPDRSMESWAIQKNIPMIYLDRYESVQHIQSYTLSK